MLYMVRGGTGTGSWCGAAAQSGVQRMPCTEQRSARWGMWWHSAHTNRHRQLHPNGG